MIKIFFILLVILFLIGCNEQNFEIKPIKIFENYTECERQSECDCLRIDDCDIKDLSCIKKYREDWHCVSS
jgi:hypothetical protein